MANIKHEEVEEMFAKVRHCKLQLQLFLYSMIG